MSQDINVFAQTTYRGQARKFGIKTDDRRRHMYIIGKTGMGKSTILENMIVNDIRAGHGVCVVDPHGDLAEKIVEYVPSERVNDVIYFNPADNEYPMAFNVIEQVEPHLRHLVASGLIGVFQKMWADSWGPRLEYILRNAILAILDYPGSTLLAVVRMLSDKPFRKKVIEKIQDPVVKSFWVNEFAGYADKFASEAVAPIQNKVGQFLSSSLMRNIVGQVKSAIDIREAMDSNKILILNLSKGRIGEDNSSLLGAMMITKIQLAAMSRVDMPEKDRKDFYLYIDEFQNFMTDSFANILSEARKYHLNLTMGHQYIEQLSEKVKPAVFGNVGTLVVHRVGAADAEELVKEFTPTFIEEDIVNLPKYEFYIKLMIDGVSSTPFSAKGLAPLAHSEMTGNVEKVIKISRERYAKKRELVEDRIMRWSLDQEELDDNGQPIETVEQGTKAPLLTTTGATMPVFGSTGPQPHNRRKDDPKPVAQVTASPTTVKKFEKQLDKKKPGFEVPCSRCAKITQTPFQPDGVRPIYCKECLEIVREEKKSETDSRKSQKEQELKKLSVPAAVVETQPRIQTPVAKKPESAAPPKKFEQKNQRPVEVAPRVAPPVVKQVLNDGGTIKTAGGGTITFVKKTTEPVATDVPVERPEVTAKLVQVVEQSLKSEIPDSQKIVPSVAKPEIQPVATPIVTQTAPIAKSEDGLGSLEEGKTIDLS